MADTKWNPKVFNTLAPTDIVLQRKVGQLSWSALAFVGVGSGDFVLRESGASWISQAFDATLPGHIILAYTP